MDDERGSTGFFGKLPSRGDFVTRRLAPAFVRPWDAWLQRAIAASQASLGSAWLDTYLTSPIWRFAVAAGVCGDDAYVGVMIPSVDKVGRYFPLVAAAPHPRDSPLAAVFAREDWFTQVEGLLLTTLAEEDFDLDAFDARLSSVELARPLDTVPLANGSRRDASAGASTALNWHCSLPRAQDVGVEMLLPLSAIVDNVVRCSLWWTQGSERVAPCALLAADLPHPEAFAALLDGRWNERGWSSLRAAGRGAATAGRSTAAARFAVRSAALTDTGKKRSVNEDSYACRDDLGVWIVADGLGGHQAGDVASRMVTSVIGQLEETDSTAQAAQLASALRVVNGCLLAFSGQRAAGGLAGSTVVALLLDADTAVCVWAGDSRVYRLRDGELRQVSRDHSDDDGSGGSRAVTRAVGGTELLELESEGHDVRGGDRYLLCTDGLYGGADAATIAAALALKEPEQACAHLKAAVLAGEATDNLTAVVVHVDARSAVGVWAGV